MEKFFYVMFCFLQCCFLYCGCADEELHMTVSVENSSENFETARAVRFIQVGQDSQNGEGWSVGQNLTDGLVPGKNLSIVLPEDVSVQGAAAFSSKAYDFLGRVVFQGQAEKNDQDEINIVLKTKKI